MRPTPESELEQIIDRELRRLPDPPAPATLIPRVLQAIADRELLPWWRKSYASWPWPARLVFLAITSGLASLLVYFTWGLSIGATMDTLAREAGDARSLFLLFEALAGALASAVAAIVRAGGSTLLWIAAGVLGACYLTTLALGTFCYRLVLRRI